MLAIELPADLEQEVLRHSDVQQFVVRAIKRLLFEEKQQNQIHETMLLSEQVLAKDWLKDEEEEAWAHLQSGKL